jgi:hypothetical protein
MRGFSLIEVLLAFAVATVVIISSSLSVISLPASVQNAELLFKAASAANLLLAQSVATKSEISSTTGVYQIRAVRAERDDPALTTTTSAVSWMDAFNQQRTLAVSVVSTDNDMSNPCDDFIEGDWSRPLIRASYLLSPGKSLPVDAPKGAYELAAIAGTPRMLIAAIASTTDPGAPTLLFYSAQGTNPSLSYAGGFDNASTSRIGFRSLAVASDYGFAGNAFGSKSAQTCSDAVSCAQVQVFSLSPTPQRIAALQLASSSPPFAVDAAGASAAAASLFYDNGYLYVGLQKTMGGDEFNIIDVQDPTSPFWIGGLPIGRTVAGITVRDSIAYLSTDDPSRELQIVDVHSPNRPLLIGSYDAPGASGFGYGVATKVRDGIVRFGRSYIGNAPELQILDARNPTRIASLQEMDIGTPQKPASFRSFVTMDALTFALFNNQLVFLETWENQRVGQYSDVYPLPAGSTGVALACRDNLLYLARNSSGGGNIDVLSAS